MLPTKQIFFLPFVALIIIFLVYHKLISNHKASFVVVLDFCLFRMFFFFRGCFYLLVCLITFAIIAWEVTSTCDLTASFGCLALLVGEDCSSQIVTFLFDLSGMWWNPHCNF